MNKHRLWLSSLLVLTLIACSRSATPAKPEQAAGEKTRATAQKGPKQLASPQIIVHAKALNPITLQLTFEKPLPPEDLVLRHARNNFAFTAGLSIRDVPRLKSGTKATYLIPTTVQKTGHRYILTYKGNTTASFDANPLKLPFAGVKQVSYDTFEIESFLTQRVTDYQNVIADTPGKRGGFSFELDDHNRFQGKSYQIIPSLQDAQLFVIPKGGNTIITASYVPQTQLTDGRQAPKFRLPDGVVFKPGTTYTITSDWAAIDRNSLRAGKIAPLPIKAVKRFTPSAVEVVLATDPKDEVFASRSIVLTAPNGRRLTATYRENSRKGASGIFDVQAGATLAIGTTYAVQPAGPWAIANHVNVRP
ncbi:hypothetical protein ACTID9_07835 [Brevibacillus fluminis]|uniref:hypothetical protein n=1 Tax=Brevibacillus fluminis TaxID=511487 RepID=UPI003F89D9DD